VSRGGIFVDKGRVRVSDKDKSAERAFAIWVQLKVPVLLIAILIALRPDLIERFKGFEMSGFKIEMLERVRERQAEQAIQLQDMSLMLPLLLPAKERKHLLNLVFGVTDGYQGSHPLSAELRRLRSFDLIRMRGDKHVSMMKDGMVFDLKDFIEPTALGQRWSKRIREIEDREREGAADDGSSD
jgi:hypothetical protein